MTRLVSSHNSRLSFYYRLPVVEKCLEKCLKMYVMNFNSEVCEMFLNQYGWPQRKKCKNS